MKILVWDKYILQTKYNKENMKTCGLPLHIRSPSAPFHPAFMTVA